MEGNIQDLFNLFYAWVIDQKPEVSDPTNEFQCMDLIFAFAMFLRFPKDTLAHLYAYQVFTNPNSSTKEYFDIIPNSPTFVPQAGDIAVFDNKNVDNSPFNIAGHVSVCNGKGDINSFQSLDENWTANGRVTIITHDYNKPKLLGVLRPKISKLFITDQTKISQIRDENNNPMEVQAIRSKLQDQDIQIINLKKELLALKNSPSSSVSPSISPSVSPSTSASPSAEAFPSPSPESSQIDFSAIARKIAEAWQSFLDLWKKK